jgi:hypothetical protein
MHLTREPPYEYCAARFLNQWESKERPHWEALSRDPKKDDVRKALHYFQVARSFAGLSEKGDSIVRALCEASEGLEEQNVVERVSNLADRFREDFGSRNLSAASKLLWLRCRSPVLIFDSRARDALRQFKPTKVQHCYSAFCLAWRDEFNKRQAAIENAIQELGRYKAFTSAWLKSQDEFHDEITARWFTERTFDIFLWVRGGKS